MDSKQQKKHQTKSVKQYENNCLIAYWEECVDGIRRQLPAPISIICPLVNKTSNVCSLFNQKPTAINHLFARYRTVNQIFKD
ncbi:hypothetical protein BpHYR1_011211 [Brachionus plicatilis]|uniref:Uncharacterized protein n=1 Tax=Brachionus plicatilis TaxID=10195 RepID=A0A3M7SP24_BRAPC|nr:hypothetical protein BpHYR1_011211 [Brachionus plicatilis]